MIFTNFPLEKHRLYLSPMPSCDSSLSCLTGKNSKLDLVIKSIAQRKPNLVNVEKYALRLATELEIFSNSNHEHIFDILLTYDDLVYAYEEQNAVSNISRGPTSSSLVCFGLGVAQVNAIDYNLPFERFWSENKFKIQIDMPNHEATIERMTELFGENIKRVKVRRKKMLRPVILDLLLDLKIKPKLRKHIASLVSKDNISEIEKFRLLCKESVFMDILLANPSIENKVIQELGEVKSVSNYPGLGLIYWPYDSDVFTDELELGSLYSFDIIRTSLSSLLQENYSAEQLSSLPLVSEVFQSLEKNNYKNRHFHRTHIPLESLEDMSLIVALHRPAMYDLGIEAFRPDPEIQIESYLECSRGFLVYQEQFIKILSDRIPPDDLYVVFKKFTRRTTFDLPTKQKMENYLGEKLFNFLSLVAPYLFCKSHALSYAYQDYAVEYFRIDLHQEFSR